MHKKTLEDKVIRTIIKEILSWTEFEVWTPEGKAILAIRDNWTGQYKYFYKFKSLLNWWAETFE